VPITSSTIRIAPETAISVKFSRISPTATSSASATLPKIDNLLPMPPITTTGTTSAQRTPSITLMRNQGDAEPGGKDQSAPLPA